ncbi:hypothetical protein, partial [Escherichia coli]
YEFLRLGREGYTKV